MRIIDIKPIHAEAYVRSTEYLPAPLWQRKRAGLVSGVSTCRTPLERTCTSNPFFDHSVYWHFCLSQTLLFLPPTSRQTMSCAAVTHPRLLPGPNVMIHDIIRAVSWGVEQFGEGTIAAQARGRGAGISMVLCPARLFGSAAGMDCETRVVEVLTRQKGLGCFATAIESCAGRLPG